MKILNHRLSATARAALLWGLCLYAGLQLGLAVIMEKARPELRDPEFGYKLVRLRKLLKEEPDRPLIIILGSSRAGLGLRPAALGLPKSERSPIIFNFALTGAGPVLELLCLRRLLTAGIHPDEILVEVLPPNLHLEGSWSSGGPPNIERLGVRDLETLRPYEDAFGLLCRTWVTARITPWYSRRFCIMSEFAAGWLPWSVRQDGWLGLDPEGWLPYPRETVDEEQYQRAVEAAHHTYAEVLQHYQIAGHADRALRALLDLCRQEHIGVTLFLMPEGTAFRSWYAPATRVELDHYLSRMQAEYRVPLIDAQNWMPDEYFLDSHHLLPRGAAVFSQRLGHEILEPKYRHGHSQL